MSSLALGGTGAHAQQGPQDRGALPAGGVVSPGDRLVGPFYLLGPVPTFIRAPGDAPRPLSVTLRQGFRHHSNLFALPDPAPPEDAEIEGSDNVSVTGVRLAYDNMISGQLFNLYADVSYNDYRNFDELDNTAWGLGGRWAWQAGRQWYGTLLVDSQRFLNPFENQNQPLRNMIGLNTLAASVGYRLDPSWSAFVGADFRDRDNSASAEAQNDLRENGIEAGVRFRPPETSTDSSFVYRYVDGKYPNQQLLDATGAPLPIGIQNEFDDQSLLARFASNPTAASRIIGEIGWTRRSFDTLSARDFSGLTGSVVWQWQASEAIDTELFLRRSLGPVQLGSANYVDTLQAGGLVNWRPTGKLTLSARVARDDYEYAGDPAAAAGLVPEREDRSRVFGLGAAWEIRRNIELTAEYRNEDRSSNFDEFEFESDIVAVFLRIRFD